MQKCIIFCLLLLCLTLAACRSNPENEPQPEVNTMQYTSASFKELLGEQVKEDKIAIVESDFAIAEYHDITPTPVKETIGCQIFKDGKNCESYLLHNDQIYRMGIGFGGYGVIDIHLCDFDGDGQQDLLYTDSSGSGVHRWEAGIFNMTTLHDTTVFASMGALKPQYYMADTILVETGDNQFDIYTARINLPADINFANLSIEQDEKIGRITKDGHTPHFIFEPDVEEATPAS